MNQDGRNSDVLNDAVPPPYSNDNEIATTRVCDLSDPLRALILDLAGTVDQLMIAVRGMAARLALAQGYQTKLIALPAHDVAELLRHNAPTFLDTPNASLAPTRLHGVHLVIGGHLTLS